MTNFKTAADMNQELQNAKDIGMLSVRLEAAVDRLTETAERLEKSQSNTDEQVEQLRREVVHYKGIVGGIAFVLSGMFTLLVAFKSWIFNDAR